MSSIAHLDPAAVLAPQGSLRTEQGAIETWFRRVMWAFAAVAVLGAAAHFGLLLWAQHQFTDPESIVGAQSLMFARSGTLYGDLNSYPYTVRAYTPLFYFLEATVGKAGLSTILAGRLLSFAAMLGMVALIWRLLLLYTGDRYCAATGALLGAGTALFLTWGTIGQVDMLAILWAIAAFYQYSRYFIRGEKTLLWAGVFVFAAFFTKQTMIACPAAIFVHLLLRRRWKTALAFGLGLATAVAAIATLLNLVFAGHFFANTVFANMNPFDLDKMRPHLQYIMIATGPLIVVAAIGFLKARRGHNAAPFIYCGMAAGVWAITAPKIGSDANYQIEVTAALILCACVTLRSLDFFTLSFQGSKKWITLLQLPLAVYLVQNFRITEHVLLTRVVNEQLFRAQFTALRPYAADGGRLLSTDFDSMTRLRGYMDVEPLIYHLLVRAGKIDPEPLRRDIAAQAFSTIFLYEDVNHPDNFDLEVSTFPPAQILEIKDHYRLVAHVPGPYLNGVFVYKPVGKSAE